MIDSSPAAIASVESLCEDAFRTHWHDVLRLALAWTNDWAAAEDIAQEAYVRLWKQRAAFDWSRPVLPWLLRATRNLATDRFRHLRRRVLPPVSALTLDEASRDRWLGLRDALSGLSKLERTCLMATTVIGLSYAEVAGLLGVSEGAARSAVSRARTKLEAQQ